MGEIKVKGKPISLEEFKALAEKLRKEKAERQRVEKVFEDLKKEASKNDKNQSQQDAD